jgi:nucleolar complex protein 2
MAKKRLRLDPVKQPGDFKDLPLPDKVIKMKTYKEEPSINKKNKKDKSKKTKKHKEEIDDDEEEEIKQKSKKGKNSIKTHQDELQSLKDKDPEFFEFLKKNDQSLLEFGEDDDDDEDMGFDDDDVEGDEELYPEDDDSDDDNNYDGKINDDDSMSEDDEIMTKKSKKVKIKNKDNETFIEVTEELLQDVIKLSISGEGSISNLKKLLSMFRTACMPSGSDVENDEEGNEEDGPTGKYSILSPEVYEQVMVGCIDNAHIVFYKQLGTTHENLTEADLLNMENHPKWKKIQLQVLSFFKSILHTLSSVSAGGNVKQGQVCVYLMNSLECYIPLLSPLTRLAKGVVKVLLGLWSSMSANVAEDVANVRGHAFLRIRQMAIVLPGSMTEECFRSMYLTFARQCKSFTELNCTSVLFMSQCVAELYTVDPAQAYQQAFLYIRQLALHLRAASVKKTAESSRQITSWQFLNCVRLWTRVLCLLPGQNQLGALVFPLSQIIFGIIAAAQSMYLLPLRFHLITCLHQLSASSETFIPTTQKLLDILEHNDLVTKPMPSTDISPKLQFLVRLPADSITKVTTRDTIVLETIHLLRQDAELYRFHPGFPEYGYLTIRKLRVFSKKSKVGKWRDMARTVAGTFENYSATAKRLRSKLNICPKDVIGFEPLLPSGTAKSSERLDKLIKGRNQLTTNVVTIGNSLSTSNSDIKNKVTKSKKVKKVKVVEGDVELDDNGLVDKVGKLDWSDSEDDGFSDNDDN